MEIGYRLFDGSADDAARILKVEAACWDESPHSPDSLRALLTVTDRQQMCWLAEAVDEVVGFLHSFLTDGLGGPIWELDLLAVTPAWRGKGIATTLVRAAARAAPDKAVRGRAFVAAHNVPSARAFRRAGFVPDAVPHEVYVRRTHAHDEKVSPRSGEVHLEQAHPHSWRASAGDHEIRLQEVHTVLHSGIWVEGFNGRMPGSLLQAALAHAGGCGVGWVDVILPKGDGHGGHSLRGQGFRSLGAHLVWTCGLPLSG